MLNCKTVLMRTSNGDCKDMFVFEGTTWRRVDHCQREHFERMQDKGPSQETKCDLYKVRTQPTPLGSLASRSQKIFVTHSNLGTCRTSAQHASMLSSSPSSASLLCTQPTSKCRIDATQVTDASLHNLRKESYGYGCSSSERHSKTSDGVEPAFVIVSSGDPLRLGHKA